MQIGKKIILEQAPLIVEWFIEESILDSMLVYIFLEMRIEAKRLRANLAASIINSCR